MTAILLTKKVCIKPGTVQRVDTIYGVLKDDEDLGPLIKKKIPQGSWPQKTIISPQNGRAFDGDFMVQMVEDPTGRST